MNSYLGISLTLLVPLADGTWGGGELVKESKTSSDGTPLGGDVLEETGWRKSGAALKGGGRCVCPGWLTALVGLTNAQGTTLMRVLSTGQYAILNKACLRSGS
jgi:hypothetical protein